MKVNSSSHLIYSIIQELLLREQKKLDYLKDRILPHYKDPESIQVVKNLYSKDEQLLLRPLLSPPYLTRTQFHFLLLYRLSTCKTSLFCIL